MKHIVLLKNKKKNSQSLIWRHEIIKVQMSLGVYFSHWICLNDSEVVKMQMNFRSVFFSVY